MPNKKEKTKQKVLDAITKNLNRDDVDVDQLIKDLSGLKAGGPDTELTKVLRKGSRHSTDWRVNMKAGISTGIGGIDEILEGGIRRGELGLLAGVPEAGKTRTLCNFASVAVQKNYNIAYATLEQPWDQIRMFLIMARYDLWENQVSWPYKRRIKRLEDKGKIQPIDFSDIPCRIDQLHQAMYLLDPIPDILFLDYLDLVLPTTRAGQRRFDYGDVSQELAMIAKEFKCAVWTATQAAAEAIQYGIKDLRNLSEAKIEKSKHISIGIGVNPIKNNTQKFQCFKARRGRRGLRTVMVNTGKYKIC